MRKIYPVAFKLLIGIEGHLSTDPKDPGNYYPDGSPGFTVWGLSTRYNENLRKDMPLSEAMDMYYFKYWIPAGCENPKIDDQWAICLFDSQVNPQNDPKLPGGGNQEIMNLKPKSWQDYNILRMQRYMRCSKPEYVKGHIFRVLRLSESVRNIVITPNGTII
jgi:hypothetical protein